MASRKQAKATSWPADKTERWPIEKLTPYANNPRTHSPDQVKQIVASIKEWGWTIPVLVDEKGGIIAGHGRVMAAEQLGITEIPVMIAKGWTEAQKRAYVIADNQLALNGGWDEALLRVELTSLAKLDYDLSLVGFEDVRLAAFGVGAFEPQADPDEEIEPSPIAISKLGDVWILGKHRIICGDATDAKTVDLILAGEKPHLMVTDPPYGVEYNPTWRDDAGGQFGNGKTKMRGKVENDERADWRAAWDLFKGDAAYVWCASLTSDIAIAAIESSGLVRRSQIIWRKPHFQLSRADYHWQHEPCWYVVRKGAKSHWNGSRTEATIWDIAGMNPAGRNRDPGNEKTSHGTQKPVECMKRPIENNSEPGDFIYEPFAGSGTTVIACELSGRVALAIELSPVYVDLCVRRWEKITSKRAVLQGSKRTFAQIEKERSRKAA